MKTILTIFFLAIGSLGMSGPVQAQETKMLIAYFSWSGNTKSIAEQIHQKVGGDLVEIEPLKPYSRDYNTCLEEARRDQDNKARPELKTKIDNLAQYEVIFLGYPNWWATMPIASFLEQYDFQGKTIVPFVSHGGGRLGQSVTDIAKLSPKSRILEALSVSYSGGSSLSRDIDAWLDKNGLKK